MLGMIALVLVSIGCPVAWARDFTETADLPGFVAEYSYFGTTCALDGDWLFVLSPYYSNALGGGYVYHHDGTEWVRRTLFLAPDGRSYDHFGWSASLLGDVLVVGAPFSNPDGAADAGTAYMFRRMGEDWVFEQRIQASDRLPLDIFGTAVSAGDDVVLIGAPREDEVASNAGAAYAFRFDGSSWQQEQKFTPSQPQSGLEFGESVALDGDVAVVGAQRQHVGSASEAGAVYVYRFDGTHWAEEQMLTASDPSDEAGFGSHVSVDGDFIFIGAQRDSAAALRSGATYVFEYDGAAWIEVQKLVASDGDVLTFFGERIDVQGDIALIAAPNDHEAGFRAGAVYAFEHDGSAWVETQKFTGSDTLAEDTFGLGLALSNHRAAVGALFHDKNGRTDVGAAYTFEAPWPIRDCQGFDRVETLFVNDKNATSDDFTVTVDATGPVVFSIEKPAAGGNGKFVVHLAEGAPTDATITDLPASLGAACFPFLLNDGAMPAAVWNSIGKESKVGENQYFGNSGMDPGRAPTTFLDLMSGDPVNLPIGSEWTLQGVILNPDATSPKGASITNAIRIVVE